MQKKTFFSLTTHLLLSGACFIGLLSLTASPLSAQTAEETDTTPTTTEKLKERIDKLIEQRKEKIDTVLGEVTSPKRAFVGQVSRVSETTITLNVAGTTRIVPLDSGVTLIKNGKTTAAENIAVDDWALVMGLWEDDTFTPKKIFFSEKSLRPKTQIVALGSLKEVKKTSLQFQARGQEEVLTLTLNSKTRYQDVKGETATLSQFVAEDQVLIIGYKDDDGAYATTIRALASFTKEQ